MTTPATAKRKTLELSDAPQRAHHFDPLQQRAEQLGQAAEARVRARSAPLDDDDDGFVDLDGRAGGRRRSDDEPLGVDGPPPGAGFEPSPGSGPVCVVARRRVGPEHLVQHLVERAAGPDDAERVGQRGRVDEDVAPRHRRGAAVGDRLEALERAAEVADALGQVVLVLADDGEVGVEAAAAAS